MTEDEAKTKRSERRSMTTFATLAALGTVGAFRHVRQSAPSVPTDMDRVRMAEAEAKRTRKAAKRLAGKP